MTIRFSRPFLHQYAKLSLAIRKKVDRQVDYLAQDIRHPGVHAKKLISAGDIWEGRVDGSYRFTFEIQDDTLIFRRVGPMIFFVTPDNQLLLAPTLSCYSEYAPYSHAATS
jgi:mRNA-degrading endonuclease RelE of RelBE toxin-antitoxin system